MINKYLTFDQTPGVVVLRYVSFRFVMCKIELKSFGVSADTYKRYKRRCNQKPIL